MGIGGLFKKKRAPLRLPGHIAVVMDGNGRWAKARGLPRSAGHARGAEMFRRISEYCGEIGIGQLSVFAFSTENWKRDPEEVAGIMDLLRKYLRESCEKLAQKNARLRFLGDLSPLPPDILALMDEISGISDRCSGIIVNVCINYGGRADILSAAKRLAQLHAGGAALDEFDEAAFSALLCTEGLPDPDLLIRTGAEKRISNFLLWQSAYSELYFSELLWPDFDEKRLDEAILWYSGRDRRYGGAKA